MEFSRQTPDDDVTDAVTLKDFQKLARSVGDRFRHSR